MATQADFFDSALAQGSSAALFRVLEDLYTNATSYEALPQLEDLGGASCGHLVLFSPEQGKGVRRDALRWLQGGISPWPAEAPPIGQPVSH